MEGTVRRAGDRIRLTAQLTSRRDGRVTWSAAFERRGADVFAVQDAFTTAIVGALRPRLGGSPAVTGPGEATWGTADAVAYDLYLKGRFYWAQRGSEPGDSSVRYLEATVRRDTGFARGWAGLALAHVIRPNFNTAVDFAASDARAEKAARRALALDSTLADAHAALGFLHLRNLRFGEAGADFATARRLEPRSAIVAHWSAIYFHAIGDTANADRWIDAALTLDPLSPTTFNSQALMRFERRQFANAADSYARIAALGARFTSTATNAFLWSGQVDSAVAVSQRNLSTRQRGRFGTALFALAAAGRWVDARALRERIRRGGPEISRYDLALADVAIGDRTAAAAGFVDQLERGGNLANLAFSICYPPYDAVRTEPAWKAFLARHQLRECPSASPWPIGAVPR